MEFLFLLILFMILIIDISLASFHQKESFEIAMWAKTIPVILILLAFGRLYLRHTRFSRCLGKLLDAVGDENKANAIIYRLQDREITAFAEMRKEDIRNYAQENAEKSLRWRVIADVYFN